MPDQLLPVRAAIDMGSNTIHLIIAHCKPDDLEIIVDEQEFVRIGESVTATGEISPQKRAFAITTLRQYKALAEQHAADPVLVVATEAIRQARNSREFIEQVLQETGLKVYLISGDAEATLTFLGTTYGPDLPTQIGVMDLGGGSMELITANDMHITWQVSVPVGSGWLHDHYLPSDPPTDTELTSARSFLETFFQKLPVKPQITTLIGTGGSANSLLLLARQALELSNQSTQMSINDIIRCEELLHHLTAEEIARQYNQPLPRARILLAGALIIRALMAYLNVNEIRINQHGIREGALLAYERHGEQWLEYAGRLPHTEGTVSDQQQKKPEETFADSGRRKLQERTRDLLGWREAVLKNTDIEAVHKMRVATRRLRATLDAYQICCKPAQFKRVYRTIKDLADILGTARDTDVMIANLSAQLNEATSEEQAGVQWLIKRLQIYRQQQQQSLESFFSTFDEDALSQQINSLMKKRGSSNGKS